MQTTRIDVILKTLDTRAREKTREFKRLGAPDLTDVVIVDSYTTSANLSSDEKERVLRSLVNPHIERGTIDSTIIEKPFTVAIEIGYLAGVTDNVGTTAMETITDVTGREHTDASVSSARVYALYGNVNDLEVERIKKSLYNALIERATLVTWNEYVAKHGFSKTIPHVDLHATASADIVSLSVSDEELLAMGTAGIKGADGKRRGPLALSLKDMQAIREHFKTLGRNPTDIEIEMIAQTWSEHCKHRIFASPMEGLPKGIYKEYIKRATEEIRTKKGKKDFCVSVFSDNSGVIEFDKNWLVTHKVETHNSPSALDPFGGAITGIVGVNRDAIGTGLGSKPVANMYGFCVGEPTDTHPLFRDERMQEQMLPPRRILDGVVRGINSGGNCSGIPTTHGFLICEDRFRGKPLVFAGTVGLLPRKTAGRKSWEKAARPGDLIVSVGNRVGLDGIHGATFSSVKLDEGSPATAVQIGDPITQKKFSDMLVKEARDLGLYNSITDNGAGGISSAIGEMAREAGGCRVDLEKVPVKYPGLAPWQIWISESQERMTLAVPKNKWKELSALAKRRGVEVTVIGEFTKGGQAQVAWNGKTILDLSLEFLHDGWPREELAIKEPMRVLTPLKHSVQSELGADMLALLSRPSIASHLYIAEQYDYEVQGGSVTKPVQGRGRVPAPSSVTKPVLSSKAGILMTSALYPTYSDGDTYKMAAASIDTAVRQAVVGGANLDSIAILDNFCWSRSNTPESLWDLREAGRACYETALAYETPYISGKDSMHNDFRGYDHKANPVSISIPPTLLISALAVLPNALDAVSLDFKQGGDLIYVIGETHDEFGGTEYGALYGHATEGVPSVNATAWAKVYKSYGRARKYTNAGFAVARGGLATALNTMAIGGGLGYEIDLKKLRGTYTSREAALFAESQGRIVCTVAKRDRESFEKIMGTNAVCVGKVVKDDIVIMKDGKDTVVATTVEQLQLAFEKTFKGF
ncbi:MAG: AIR synthase-related protein [bacterium]